jgi:hypothetical protein
VPQLTSTRVAGYRCSPKERNDAQLFAQSRTLRIRQTDGLDLSIADSTSPLQPVAILLLSYFHKVSRAAGLKVTNRKGAIELLLQGVTSEGHGALFLPSDDQNLQDG